MILSVRTDAACEFDRTAGDAALKLELVRDLRPLLGEDPTSIGEDEPPEAHSIASEDDSTIGSRDCRDCRDGRRVYRTLPPAIVKVLRVEINAHKTGDGSCSAKVEGTSRGGMDTCNGGQVRGGCGDWAGGYVRTVQPRGWVGAATNTVNAEMCADFSFF